MADEKGANVLDSPSNKDAGTPRPEGQKDTKSSDQLLTEYKAETERKGKGA